MHFAILFGLRSPTRYAWLSSISPPRPDNTNFRNNMSYCETVSCLFNLLKQGNTYFSCPPAASRTSSFVVTVTPTKPCSTVLASSNPLLCNFSLSRVTAPPDSSVGCEGGCSDGLWTDGTGSRAGPSECLSSLSSDPSGGGSERAEVTDNNGDVLFLDHVAEGVSSPTGTEWSERDGAEWCGG